MNLESLTHRIKLSPAIGGSTPDLSELVRISPAERVGEDFLASPIAWNDGYGIRVGLLEVAIGRASLDVPSNTLHVEWAIAHPIEGAWAPEVVFANVYADCLPGGFVSVTDEPSLFSREYIAGIGEDIPVEFDPDNPGVVGLTIGFDISGQVISVHGSQLGVNAPLRIDVQETE